VEKRAIPAKQKGNCAPPQKEALVAEKGDKAKSFGYKNAVRSVRHFAGAIWWSKSREESLARTSSVAPSKQR
jgi:hypothetical protein